MAGRTDPVEALERISWHLNYQTGEKVSLNQVANATNLAWATAHKYVKAIETIQQLAPQISTGSEGIEVGRRSKMMEDFPVDPAPAMALYLFIHAKNKGSPAEPLAISDHVAVLENAPETVEKMLSLGWIEKTEKEIELTPLGIQIAGPLYSEIKQGGNNGDQLKVGRTKGEFRAVIDSGETGTSTTKGDAMNSSSSSDKRSYEQDKYAQKMNEYNPPAYS